MTNQQTPHSALELALDAPGCERIKDFCAVGPAQRAAVESFVDALFTPSTTGEAWVGLTVREQAEATSNFGHVRSDYMLGIADAIEAKLFEKNASIPPQVEQAPQPPQADALPQRQPMTEDDAMSLYTKARGCEIPHSRFVALSIIRNTESHHGIKAKT